MSDLQELQVAWEQFRLAVATLGNEIVLAVNRATHPIVESTATVLDDTLALPEPSYTDERKQAMESEREARGE